MYKCEFCSEESEYLTVCCGENMVCSACHGSGCLICEEDKKFQE